MNIDSAKLIVLDELTKATTKLDDVKSYTHRGFNEATQHEARARLRDIQEHHASLCRIAEALGCPGVSIFRR